MFSPAFDFVVVEWPKIKMKKRKKVMEKNGGKACDYKSVLLNNVFAWIY